GADPDLLLAGDRDLLELERAGERVEDAADGDRERDRGGKREERAEGRAGVQAKGVGGRTGGGRPPGKRSGGRLGGVRSAVGRRTLGRVTRTAMAARVM